MEGVLGRGTSVARGLEEREVGWGTCRRLVWLEQSERR